MIALEPAAVEVLADAPTRSRLCVRLSAFCHIRLTRSCQNDVFRSYLWRRAVEDRDFVLLRVFAHFNKLMWTYLRALYDYNGLEGELSFREGDVMVLVSDEDNEWWEAVRKSCIILASD